jgi:TonB family protein
VALAWDCGTARADWAAPPTLAQLAKFLGKTDGVVVSSIELADSAAAHSKREGEALDLAEVRESVTLSRKWGRQFVEVLMSNVPRDSSCSCALVHRAEDSSAIVPVVQIHVGKEIATVVMAFHENCARVFLPQGTWGGLTITANRDQLWSLLREALARDAVFKAGSEAPPFMPKPTPVGPPNAKYLSPVQGFHGVPLFVEELPDAATRMPPQYPDQARERGIDGTVWVRALVGTNGAVQDTWVAWSQAYLNEAAVAAVRQWRFKPARLNGEPVAVWVMIPVKFSLH